MKVSGGRRTSFLLSAGAPALVAACLAGTAFALPFLWMVLTSLASREDALSGRILEGTLHPENYLEAVERMPIGLQARNTILITALVVTGTVLASSFVGFAFARLRFRGREFVFLLVLSSMMLPAQVTMIPQFLLFRELGWIDTFLPLTAPSFVAGSGMSAFFIFLFRQFYRTLPVELEEAARIDGCGPFRTWFRIFLPASLPAAGTCAVFSFVWTWNDFLHPLLFLQSPEKHTLTLGLAAFRGSRYGLSEVHVLMAASTLVILPCILCFLLGQRWFLRSISEGTVKG